MMPLWYLSNISVKLGSFNYSNENPYNCGSHDRVTVMCRRSPLLAAHRKSTRAGTLSSFYGDHLTLLEWNAFIWPGAADRYFLNPLDLSHVFHLVKSPQKAVGSGRQNLEGDWRRSSSRSPIFVITKIIFCFFQCENASISDKTTATVASKLIF